MWGLEPGAEVTTEANPDSVTPESLQLLADAGFTRVSFGMQSAVPHVLKVLDRTHDPEPGAAGGAVGARGRARGQPRPDLRHAGGVDGGLAVLAWRPRSSYAPDHISAYALIVEDGTKLAAQIRRGEVPGIDDDDHAAKYETRRRADLAAAGFGWYEVSNWARTPDRPCRHNLAYWRGDDWWGIGPGAHSHVGGVRWWNVKHPTAYAQRLATGVSPAAGRETLDAGTRQLEHVMLQTRIIDGLRTQDLGPNGRKAVAGLIADALIDPAAAFAGTIRLTLKGRLLADAVVRRLLED